jgi:WD40 repeat protein
MNATAKPVSHPRAELEAAPLPIRQVYGTPQYAARGDILALAFSDGATLYSCEEPGMLRCWDARVGQARSSRFLSDLETNWVFSADGIALATASDDVSLWDVESGELLTTITPPSWVTALALRTAPPRIATGHDDGVVRVWHPEEHRLLHELARHELPISALAFSPDGRLLASAGEDRTIWIWDLERGAPVASLAQHADRICSLLWSADGNVLYSAAWDRTTRVWSIERGEPIILLNSHSEQVTALAVSPDGSLLACADSAPSIHLWDTTTFQEVAVLPEPGDEIRTLAFSPDGALLASGGVDRGIRVWSAKGGQLLMGTSESAIRRAQIAAVDHGRILFHLSSSAELKLWDTVSTSAVTLDLHTRITDHIAVSPDGRWLAAGVDHRVWLRDMRDGSERIFLTRQQGRMAALAFAPDSNMLASASAADGMVWLWDVPSGEPRLVIPLAADACTVDALAFHPGGRLLAAGGVDWLATSGADGAIGIWNIVERQLSALLPRGTAALAFDPTGHWLASASLDRTVTIWDVATTKEVHRLSGHDNAVAAIAFTPDGLWLVSAGLDREIRTWRVETGELVARHTVEAAAEQLLFRGNPPMLYAATLDGSCCQIDLAQLLPS